MCRSEGQLGCVKTISPLRTQRNTKEKRYLGGFRVGRTFLSDKPGMQDFVGQECPIHMGMIRPLSDRNVRHTRMSDPHSGFLALLFYPVFFNGLAGAAEGECVGGNVSG